MTTGGPSERTVSFAQGMLNSPQPWEVEWRGLFHTGEVIVRERLQPHDFQPLSGDISFRVIFTNRGLKPRARPEDPRIALAVPRWRFDAVAETERVSSGLSLPPTSHRRDPQVGQVFRSERASQQSILRTRIIEGYARGRLYGPNQDPQEARGFFSHESVERCVTELAARMLSDAFPSPVYDHTGFPRALAERDISALFSGLVHGDRSAVDTIRAFGPGLEVVSEGGTEFDCSRCRVHGVIEQELDSRGGQMPASDLIHALVHGHGLNRSLALFYLLTFVRHAHAEITLTADHDISISGSQRFEGDRITRGLVGAVAFSNALISAFDIVTLEPAPTWESALPYIHALEAAHEPDVSASSEIREPGQRLRRVVDLRKDVLETLRALEGFQTVFPGSANVADRALADLEALSAAAGYGSDYAGFYNTAEERFGSPANLTNALETFERVKRLALLVEDICQARTYLDRMSFGPGHQDLALERDALVARIEPASLEPNPSLWSAVEVSLHRFRQRYAQAYQTHHSEYHRQAAHLRNDIEQRGVRVNALSQLIQVPELGEAVGVLVPDLFDDLAASVRQCALESDLDLESAPWCQQCQLPIDESVPERQAREVFGILDASMREYNHRLSTQAARRVLADGSSEQMDKLISLIQVADPSSLENVLDDDVITFLKGFMR